MTPDSIDLPELMGLAPAELRTMRSWRYRGDDLAVSLKTFAPNDRLAVRHLYEFLGRLFAASEGGGEACCETLRTFLATENTDDLIREVRTIGLTSYEANPTALLGQVIHDIRGGGLTSIFGQMQFCQMGKLDAGLCESIYFLTRDHLKIMRNALLGLDDARREEDLKVKIHGTDLIVKKWNGTFLHAGTKQWQLQVFCPQSVGISECCVEFGALDRILYNLLNNARRHAIDSDIQLVLFPIPDVHGQVLRVVLLNGLREEDRSHLEGTDLHSLFQPGVSTTGSGFGLTVAAEFVARAFGISSPEEAIEKQFLGVKLLHDKFAVWFHWPIVAEPE